MRDKLIVFVTMSLWDEPHRGRHHYANALAENNTVIWIDRPLYWKDKRVKVGLEHIDRGLYVLHAGPTLFPHRIDHRMNWCNQSRLNLLIKTLKEAPFAREPDLVWIYDFKATQFACHFRGSCPRIYFCNDYFGEYAYDRYESILCPEVDHVFCTAPKLRDRLISFNKQCTFLPHGAWIPAEPSVFVKKERPETVGYIGTLREDIDISFLTRILDETDLRLVLAGPVTECLPEQRARFEQLLSDSRVTYLGNLRQDEIHKNIREIDICLLPYLIDLRQFMFPLKFFDYLAAGKPIVATPYFEWPEPYDRFVSVWNPGQDIRSLFDGVYSTWNANNHKESLALAEESAWPRRVEQVSSIVLTD